MAVTISERENMKKITLLRNDGVEFLTQPVVHKRKGSKCNYTLLFVLTNGYRITPYEFNKRSWKYKHSGDAMNLIFSILYDDDAFIKNILYAKNPLLELMRDRKDYAYTTFYIPSRKGYL